MFVLKTSGNWYYTGRVNSEELPTYWVSDKVSEAFQYDTKEWATRKAATLNRMTAMGFEVVELI